jgi:ribosomal protein L29
MKFKEVAKLSSNECDSRLKELRLDLMKLKTQVATGSAPKDSGKIKAIKKDIARIKQYQHMLSLSPNTSVKKDTVQKQTSENDAKKAPVSKKEVKENQK